MENTIHGGVSGIDATLIPYYGGKALRSIRNALLALYPPHKVYVDPFIGGGGTLWGKTPSEKEVVSDIDPNLIALYRQVQENPSSFKEIAGVYSEEEFYQFLNSKPTSQKDLAFRKFILARQSYSGYGHRFANNHKSTYQKYIAGLKVFANRLKNVEISCCSYITSLVSHNHKDTFAFVDPPYLEWTLKRAEHCEYIKNFSIDDHTVLLKVLRKFKGKVLLCGYRSELYDYFLQGKKWHSLDISNRTIRGKEVIETVWANYPFEEKVEVSAVFKATEASVAFEATEASVASMPTEENKGEEVPTQQKEEGVCEERNEVLV